MALYNGLIGFECVGSVIRLRSNTYLFSDRLTYLHYTVRELSSNEVDTDGNEGRWISLHATKRNLKLIVEV